MKPPIQPPDGYRMLREGEIIQNGDLALYGGRKPWLKIHSDSGLNWTSEHYYPMCRKIEKDSGTKDSKP